MNRITNIPSQEKIDALYRAAEVAAKDGDNAHAAALRRAARINTRLLREIDVGLDGATTILMGD